jgi:hypothetical protein
MDQLTGLIREAADDDFAGYRPRPVVNATNALQPLGKGAALDSLEEYLAGCDLSVTSQRGLFWVLRTLFEVPDDPGFHPPVLLGSSTPPPPARLEALPRFPVALVRDIPLLLVSGFVLGGAAEPVTAHILHFRRTGRIRTGLLQPSDDADGVVEEFAEIFHRAYGEAAPWEVVDRVRRQAHDIAG